MKIKLQKVEIPEIKEVKTSRGPYYLTNQKNDYYKKLLELYDNSSIHKAILNNLRDKIVGSNIEATRKIKQMIKSITLDMVIFGGFSVEIIWNLDHTKINQMNYIDFTKVLSGYVDEKTDQVELYYYSNNWSDMKNNEIEVFKTYSPDPESDNRQIYYFKDHTPGFDVYPKPYYNASIRWVYTDVELCRYYSNLVKNNFVSNVIISMRNGFDDPDKQEAFEKDIIQNFTGSENAGSIPVIYGDGTDVDPIKIVQFNTDPDDQKYQWLSQHTMDQLIIGHRVPNPMLVGMRIPGSLGGTQELTESENIYNKNMVYPFRENIYTFLEDVTPFYILPIGTNITDISMVSQQNITE